MNFDFGAFNNWGPLKKVAIRTVDAAFVSDAKIDAEWRDLNFHSRPDLANARREYAVVEEMLAASGAEVIKLPPAPGIDDEPKKKKKKKDKKKDKKKTLLDLY